MCPREQQAWVSLRSFLLIFSSVLAVYLPLRLYCIVSPFADGFVTDYRQNYQEASRRRRNGSLFPPRRVGIPYHHDGGRREGRCTPVGPRFSVLFHTRTHIVLAIIELRMFFS